MPDTKPVVLLVTTNGAGMGHLARQTAVGQAATDFAPFLVSMSVGVATVLTATDLPGEYVPGYTRGWVPRGRWDRYLTDRLEALVDATGAAAVVFDGVAPYRGVTALARRRPGLPFVWFRRGMWREGVGARALRASRYFDMVIEPGDLAAASDRGATAQRHDALRIPPVTLLSTTPSMPRDDAAAALGLDPRRPTVLVTLGAGNLNDTSAPTTAAIRAALDAPGDWQVAVTHAPISDAGGELAGRVTVLRGVFPLVAYAEAFDAVVAAAGYNAVHEFVLGGIPTLLVPNAATATDDQIGRAGQLASAGRCLTAPEDNAAALAAAVDLLLQQETRERLSAANPGDSPRDGAQQAAAAISTLIGVEPGRRPGLDLGVLRADALAGARAVLGDERYTALTSRLGRPQLDLTLRPVMVESGGAHSESADAEALRELLITSDLRAVTPSVDPIVEHLGVDDPWYRARRRAIIEEYYDVRGRH